MEPMHEPVWIKPKENVPWLEQIVREFSIHPITAQILISRNFNSLDAIHQFLYAQLPDLYDPKRFLDMTKAVRRIDKALKKEEVILIYGDNDVDGMTGTALLADFFKRIGGNVKYYVPNQNVQRGQLFLDALEFAEANNCKLMITVD